MRIYLAGCEGVDYLHIAKEAGCEHYLYTAWAYLSKSYNMGSAGRRETNGKQTFHYIKDWNCRTILDSGIFTLMFGNHKLNINDIMIKKYQESYINLIKENEIASVVVECDCQNLVGAELAWKLRRRLKDALPRHEIINVVHKSDGVKGLDRIIEFSDYIAIGCPEQKRNDPKKYKDNITRLAHYMKIKNRKLRCICLDVLAGKC